MDNQNIAGEWFKIAEADLASAEFLQKMSPCPIEIICYHCQQSAEKYLKGYLAFRGDEPQKTHDLTKLNRACQKSDPDFEELEDDCLMLTDFGVNVRYPFPMDVDASDLKLALKSAKRIKQFVLAKTEL